MYDEGEGVAENDATAVKWYTLAAEQGVADAQSECSAQTIPPLISGGKTSGAKR